MLALDLWVYSEIGFGLGLGIGTGWYRFDYRLGLIEKK